MHFGEEAYIVNGLSTYHVNNAVRLNAVRLFLQLLVGGLMSYLRYMCLFAYSVWCPTRIVLCFRFVYFRLVYPMLPVSLDCSFLIAPTIFSNVYFIRFFVLPRVSEVFPFE